MSAAIGLIVSIIVIIWAAAKFKEEWDRRHGKEKGEGGKTTKRTPTGPVRVQYTCPYCGNQSFLFRSGEELKEQFYHCGECHREWGNTATMTPAHRQSVALVDRECAMVESAPELNSLMRTVGNAIAGSGGRAFVTAHSGSLYLSKGGQSSYLAPMGSLAYLTTHGGKLHFFHLCMKTYQRQFPRYKMSLMDEGMSWE